MSAIPAVTIVYDDVFLLHGVPGHPERPERLQAIVAGLRQDQRLVSVPWDDGGGQEADLDLLMSVHPERHVLALAGLSKEGGGWIDADTYCAPESFRVAKRAAGATVRAAELVCTGRSRHAFALVRPPGHHATATRAMGFCLFNNAALAVRAMQRDHGADRVAIIDTDVHHGNGSQEIFYDDPSVLYASVHQYPFYPGTGAASETGHGAGEGTTVNVPVPAGTDGDAWLAAFSDRVVPAVAAFQPQALVVSAGYDAHKDDPLAELLLTTEAYAEIACRIRDLAGTLSIPSLWVLEGGYNLHAIAESVGATVNVLRGEDG